MKSLYHCLILSLLLAAIGCGKENESGKSGGVCLQYGYNGQCNQYSNPLGNWHNYNLNAIVNGIQSQCPYGRQQLSGTVISQGSDPNQLYLGVTSVGDILIVQGTGQQTSQYTLIICGGGMMNGGVNGGMMNGGQLQANLGAYATCGRIKPAFASINVGGIQKNFRDAAGGSIGGIYVPPLPICSQQF